MENPRLMETTCCKSCIITLKTSTKSHSGNAALAFFKCHLASPVNHGSLAGGGTGSGQESEKQK